ncbi:unnamed protein product [Lactuca saligna]|uniref:Aconitase/3-isopropylmalate dehydratase large subunit alpha/beta/alpha domain-containing protein n=1 Tax=Lactuca saligna TaxID=75948 RepID=A0AA35YXR8_LACSI|nr:unnamed protein product [Lactuca saligna]
MAAAAGTSEVQGLGMEEFHGCTLLHLACETVDIWMIELLLQYGVAALSGNRNFELRVHPLTRDNYLASLPLVVAYALIGTLCGSNPSEGVFVGLLLSMSLTTVVLKFLMQKNSVNALHRKVSHPIGSKYKHILQGPLKDSPVLMYFPGLEGTGTALLYMRKLLESELNLAK